MKLKYICTLNLRKKVPKNTSKLMMMNVYIIGKIYIEKLGTSLRSCTVL